MIITVQRYALWCTIFISTFKSADKPSYFFECLFWRFCIFLFFKVQHAHTKKDKNKYAAQQTKRLSSIPILTGSSFCAFQWTKQHVHY